MAKLIASLFNAIAHPRVSASPAPSVPSVSSSSSSASSASSDRARHTDGMDADRPGAQGGIANAPSEKLAAGASAIRVQLLNATQDARSVARGVKLAELTSGRGFGFINNRVLKHIAGHGLTQAGLQKLYEGCVAGSHVVIGDAGPDPRCGGFGWTVKWLDNEGKLVGQVGRVLRRDDDGALELHSHSVWVDPQFRGRAVSAGAMLAEAEMLRALSDNPRTRITLRAGGMHDPNDRSNAQAIGGYAWANFGYDFADAHRCRPQVYDYGGREAGKSKEDRPGVSDVALLREHFGKWVDRQVEAGTLPNDDELLVELKKAAKAWEHPWDISTFHVDGLTVDVKICGKTVPADLGKAFLLSGDAPRWDGAFFVNQKDTVQAKIAEGYCGKAVDKARAERAPRELALAADLGSPDAKVRERAIDAVGREGGKEWVARLRGLRADDPANQQAIDRAIEKLEGRNLPDRLRDTALDPKLPAGRRAEAAAQLSDLNGKTDFELLHRMIHAEPGVAKEALRVLADRELDAKPKVVLEEARYLAGREPPSGDEDAIWQAWVGKLLAAKVFAEAPGGRGRADLIAMSKKEQDGLLLGELVKLLGKLEDHESRSAKREAQTRLDAIIAKERANAPKAPEIIQGPPS